MTWVKSKFFSISLEEKLYQKYKLIPKGELILLR